MQMSIQGFYYTQCCQKNINQLISNNTYFYLKSYLEKMTVRNVKKRNITLEKLNEIN